MSLRVCILASGSSGNCTYVGSPATGILIDAGLSGRETKRRLEQIDVDLDALSGICLSHEHGDHVAGVRVLHNRHGLPLFANRGTIDGLAKDPRLTALPWNVFETGSPFQIGDLLIEPFSVPHDAYDPVGFVVSGAGAKVGVVTDMGIATALIRQRLRDCDAVVVESNHDERMLEEAERPWSLKQRIKGRQGHLSNQHAVEMLTAIAGPRLRHVFLAHISEDCNERELAMRLTMSTLGEAGHKHIRVSCTFPDRISDVWTDIK